MTTRLSIGKLVIVGSAASICEQKPKRYVPPFVYIATSRPREVFMRRITPVLRVYGLSGLVLLGSALPAQATDIVPFVGFRFGGDVGTQPGTGVTGPTSVTIDSSVSYGGVIDIPLSQPRSVELYYSRQPTKLSGNSAVGDVTMSLFHVGLVDALPSADQQLSWLLIGTVGATETLRPGWQRNPTEHWSRRRLQRQLPWQPRRTG